MNKCLSSVALLIFVSGCVHYPSIQPNDIRFSPITTASEPLPKSKLGAIYQHGYGVPLWEDQLARRVGDILTVVLDERTVSSKSTKTEISKNDDNTLGVTSLFGRGVTNNGNALLSAETSNSRAFKGDADSEQNNRLQGSITVTVAKVYPNGNLFVRGEKWLTLAQGEEFIRITGIVRPKDVSPDNSIMSTKLADARIAYSGTGALADSGRIGWFSRFLTSPLWPF